VLYDRYRKSEVAAIHTIALTAGDSMSVDVVEVPLRIRSARTIGPDDLRVRENDVEQTIRDIRPDRGPAHFAFVVDRSLSMGDGKLDAALRAVAEGMKLLRADDTASLILFNHNVERRLTLPSSRARGEGAAEQRVRGRATRRACAS